MCYPDANTQPEPMPWWPVLAFLAVVALVVGCYVAVVRMQADWESDMQSAHTEGYLQGAVEARQALRDEMVDLLVQAREQGVQDGLEQARQVRP